MEHVDPLAADMLGSLRRLRNRADYDINDPFSLAAANAALEAASQLLELR